MKAKKIRQQVRSFFKDENFNADHIDYITPAIADSVHQGRAHDADAVLLAVLDGEDGLQLGLTIGRSILFGGEAHEYLLEYYGGNTDSLEKWIDEAANEIGSALARKPVGGCSVTILRRVNDESWRGFRGSKPMTVDEVRALARRQRN